MTARGRPAVASPPGRWWGQGAVERGGPEEPRERCPAVPEAEAVCCCGAR